MQAEQIADEIFAMYDAFGGHEYGEGVSQLEHMAQSAQCAEAEGYDEEVILAAFLHDVGHLIADRDHLEQMDGYGAIDHEKIAGEYLRKKGFSEKLAVLVESHVEAKRYLTFADSTYFAELSDASRITLEYQGGRMNAEEAQAFEQNPLFEMILKMRSWDEAGKMLGVPVPDLAIYRDMMLRHLNRN